MPMPTSNNPTLLSIRNLAKSFGNSPVLRGISLEVAEGEFLTILGESGSGKTTLLRLIAGLEQLDSGEIWISGERLDPLPPYRRRVNTVFQQYALFPHLNAFDNVAYGLRVRRTPKEDIEKSVNEALAMVKMLPFARSFPAKTSGGQQQRIALARALVNRPRLLLLDEPLSALDANLRRQMQLELKSLQREVGIAFVFVTHDQDEAMALSDRIALLRSGVLEQVASPSEIYNRPATAYAAAFIGQTNLLRGAVRGGIAHVGVWEWRCAAPDGPATFSLRPEQLRLSAPAGAENGAMRFRARVRDQVFQGVARIVQLEAAGQLLVARVPGAADLGDEVEVEFTPADAVPVRDNQSERGVAGT
jgi:spermidine/putrescine transport system ATP-binding protein